MASAFLARAPPQPQVSAGGSCWGPTPEEEEEEKEEKEKEEEAAVDLARGSVLVAWEHSIFETLGLLEWLDFPWN